MKILIGALVAAILMFGAQSVMWMGGIHNDFAKYTPKQDSLLAEIGSDVGEEGLYFLPGWDPNQEMTSEQREAKMKERNGKPWAMVFYHKAQKGMEPTNFIKSILYALIGGLMAAMVLFYGGFESFGTRFMVSYAFAVFALTTSILNVSNWWDYPWGFLKAAILDVCVGWLIASIWLAWYMKKPAQN